MRLCPVCSGSQFTVLLVTPTGQSVLCCADCGMVFADGGAAFDYAADSIYTCTDTYGEAESQAPRFAEAVARITRTEIPKDAHIVDIGCAAGGLLRAFASAGYPNVKGVSLSEGEVALCRSQGIDAEVRSVEHPDRRYDVVTLSHVLEHVPDVQGFLANLRRWVKPGAGVLYVEVPDACRYDTHLVAISQGFNSEHINHFSLPLLIATCATAGMEVVDSGTGEAWFNVKFTAPIAWATFRVRAPHDPALKASIERYIGVLHQQMEEITGNIQLKDVSHYALWGLGQSTQLLIAAGTIDPARVAYATDTNPSYHGQTIGSAIVVSPENFAPPADVPILVCAQQSKDAILARIRELGFPNRIITL